MRAITLSLFAFLLTGSMAAQDVSCTSTAMTGTTTTSCLSANGTYFAISCSGSTCRADATTPTGNVYVPSLDGVRLELGMCDKACHDRLIQRQEVAVKRAAVFREIGMRQCLAHPDQFETECRLQAYIEVYNSLSDCDAHRLTREKEKQYCSPVVVNDPLRTILDMAGVTP